MDVLPFPLLISHCLGVWPGATEEKLPCLLLHACAFLTGMIASWRAKDLGPPLSSPAIASCAARPYRLPAKNRISEPPHTAILGEQAVAVRLSSLAKHHPI